MLAELLRQEGIAARFRGPATTLVGVAEHIVAMAVEVPAESGGATPWSSCAIWKTRPSPPTDRPRLGGEHGRRRLHDDLPDDRRRPGRTGGGDAAGRRDRRALPLHQQRADRDARRLDRDGARPFRSNRRRGRASCSRDLEYVGAAEAVGSRTTTTCRTMKRSRSRRRPRAGGRWPARASRCSCPGPATFTRGRPWTALVLALAASWCISAAIAADRGSTRFDTAVATICMIVLCDMIQAACAPRAAEIRGVRASVAGADGRGCGAGRRRGAAGAGRQHGHRRAAPVARARSRSDST